MAQPTFDPTQPFVEEKSVPQAPVFDPSQPFVDEDVSQPQVAVQRPRSVQPIQVPTPEEIFGRQAPSREEKVKTETWEKLSATDKLLGSDLARLPHDFLSTLGTGASGIAVKAEGMDDEMSRRILDMFKVHGGPQTPEEKVAYDKAVARLGMSVSDRMAAADRNIAGRAGRALKAKAERDYPSIQPADVSRPLGGAASGVGSIGASLVTAPLGAGTTAVWAGLMEFSDAYEQEIQRQQQAGEEINPDLAQQKANVYAAGAVPLEYIGGAGRLARRWFGKAAEVELKKQAKKKGAEAIGEFFKERLKDAFAEGGTEALQQLYQDAIVQGKPEIANAVQAFATAAGGTLVLGTVAQGTRVAAQRAADRTGVPNANQIQSPVAPPGVPEAGRVPGVGQAPAGAVQEVAPAGEAKGAATVAPLGPDMDTARRIIQMTPDEFLSQAKSFNKWNIAIGQNATPEDYAELKQLRDQAVGRFQQAQAALATDRSPKALQDFATLGMMPQFYNEAIAEYEKKNLPPAPGAGAGPTQPAEAGTPGQVVKPEGGVSSGQEKGKEKGLQGDVLIPEPAAGAGVPDASVPEGTKSETILDESKYPTRNVPIANVIYSHGAVEDQSDTTYHDLLTNWQTADTVLEALAKDENLTPFERQLLDRFKGLGMETRVKLMPQSEAARRGIASANGVYNTRGDFIYLFPSSPNNTRTLLHEFTHAATVKAMATDPQFAAELDDILKAAKEQIKNTGLYGLANTNELIAEAFTSPEFQKALQGVKVGNETLWDRFVNWVRRVLGLPSNQKNALQRVIELSSSRFSPNNGTPVEMNGQAMTLMPPGPVELPALTAFHGTPHQVDRFSTEKIGTGEGAQVYGWGLYFAQNENVANQYAQTLGNRLSVDGKVAPDRRELMPTHAAMDSASDLEYIVASIKAGTFSYATHGPILDRALTRLDNTLKETSSGSHAYEASKKVLDWWDSLGDINQIKPESIVQKPGTAYTVSINAEPDELLDWDKPLSEQSEKVKSALESLGFDKESSRGWGYSGMDLYRYMAGGRGANTENFPHALTWFTEDAKASAALFNSGIKGIRYLDQGSRGGNYSVRKVGEGSNPYWMVLDGNGNNVGTFGSESLANEHAQSLTAASPKTYNYVIFDDKDITITHENGREVSPMVATHFPGDLASMPNEPERNQMGDNLADIEASGELEKALDDAQKDGLFDKTQRMGVQDAILGRQHLTPEVRAAGEAYSEAIFRQAGLPVEPDEDGWFQLSDPNTPQEAQGHKLLELVRGELAKYADDKSGYLGHLINSIRNNMAPGSGVKAFSEPLLLDLYSATQGEASHRGLLLGALAGLQKSIVYVGRNVKAMLHKEYHTRFGGDFVDKVLPRIITEFRGFFTDAEIDDAVKNNPKLKEFFDKVFALNRADIGGRLYRRVQSYLKPRGKKAKAMVENAKLEEAFNEIIAQAEKLGITKPPVEGKKALTPREALAVMAKPETTDQLNQAIEIAVGDAEKAAGRKVALKEAKDEEARAEIMSEEWEPTEDQVEAGLDLPEFAHWREIRDNLLGYSPITLKLAQKLIQSEFKGTDFGTKKTATDALKIDLNKMAISPEEEVRRVLEAYYQGVEATIARAGASQETRDRVLTLVRDEVAAQLDKAKARHREPLFRDLPKPGEGKTPETRLEELTNAGLFMDPRLDSKEQVEKVAAKSPFSRLVPNLPDLIKAALETPFYRQGELGRAFADQLVKQFGVEPENVKGASAVFNQAFQTKFAKAKEMALKRVEATLEPKERREATLKKPTWKKISEAVNAGYFDSGESLRRIAKENGWMEPTDELLKKMRDWVDKMERMKELTQSELDAVGDNPVDLDRAQREKASVTLEKRVAIKKQIEAMWARLTHPLGFNKALARENMVRAIAEFASANLLFKLSFPVRQIVDVMTQGGIHTPTRAIAAAIERYQAGGDNVSFWNEAQSALRDAYRARSRSYTAALQAARDAFAGTGEARNVDRLMSRIAVFDRADQIADELQAAGKPGQAALLRLFTILRMGFRLAQAMDNLHGLPAEYQEMRQQVVTTLRENGMSSAEAFNEADKVIGDIKAEYQLAVARAQSILDGLYSAGLLDKAPTTNDVRGSAWQLVKGRQYQRMKELGLPADDFEESNRLLRSTVGWNEREEGGIGGAIGTILSTAGRVAAKSPYFTGLPFVSLTRFGNAIATSINRTLSFTPLGFFPGAFEGSPWYKSDTDKTQRKVEAAIGTALGLTVLSLAVAGLIRVRNRWPKDKEERELWEREGHRPGTVELDLGDGSFIPVSMTTGPLTLLRPWLTAGGAIRDLLDDRAKAQERLNVEAEKRGLKPGTIDPVSVTDLMAVAGWTGWGSVIGGRTASGLIGSLTDYGTPNLKKGTASVVSPLLPTVPMAQELSRMAGVRVDPKLAGVMDFLLPVPGSRAQQLNLLGDKVGTEDDIQRVIQILTGGTGLPVTPDDERSAKAYSTLYASGYRPPSVNPSRGYDFNGEYRPMTGNELSKYIELRGGYLKQELAGISGETDPRVVRQAYTAANNRALTDMGVTVARTTVSTPAATVQRTTVAPAAPRYRIPAGRALRRMPVRRAAWRRRVPAGPRRARLRSTLMPRRKTVRARALRVG